MAALGSKQSAQIAARLLHTTVVTVVQLCMCWLRRLACVHALVLVWWQQQARVVAGLSRAKQRTHVHACVFPDARCVYVRWRPVSARGGWTGFSTAWVDIRVQHLSYCGCSFQLHGASHP
jgi:hypothetical protein